MVSARRQSSPSICLLLSLAPSLSSCLSRLCRVRGSSNAIRSATGREGGCLSDHSVGQEVFPPRPNCKSHTFVALPSYCFLLLLLFVVCTFSPSSRPLSIHSQFCTAVALFVHASLHGVYFCHSPSPPRNPRSQQCQRVPTPTSPPTSQLSKRSEVCCETLSWWCGGLIGGASLLAAPSAFVCYPRR